MMAGIMTMAMMISAIMTVMMAMTMAIVMSMVGTVMARLPVLTLGGTGIFTGSSFMPSPSSLSSFNHYTDNEYDQNAEIMNN